MPAISFDDIPLVAKPITFDDIPMAAKQPAATQPEAQGVDATMQQVEGMEAPTETVGAIPGRLRDSLNATADGLLLGNGARVGAAFDAATGRAPDYNSALAGRREDQTGADERMGPAAGVFRAGGSALPFALAAPGAGAGLLARVGGSAATGAGIGAVQGAAGAEDLGDAGDVARRALVGGGIGAAAGAAVPVAGAALGGAVARGLNAINGGVEGVADSGAATIARGALEQQGAPAAREVLDRLGPLGTFGETNPSSLGFMQSLASAPGPAKATISSVLEPRSAGLNNRLEGVMNATVGPDVSPIATSEALRAERSATVNPMYNAALLDSARPDTTGALAFIAQEQQHAPVGSPYALVLARARDQLLAHDPATGGITQVADPRSIHNTMLQMRTIGERGEQGLGVQPGTADAGAATMIANHLDQALGEAAPGYDQANRVYGHYSDRLANIEHGVNALDAGKGAVRPDDLAARINGNATGQAQDIGIGMRGTLQAAVGTAGNDLAALQKLTQGEGTFTPGRTSGQPSYNEQKLGMVFGPENAARLRGAVNSEQEMQSNAVKLLGGAQSDFRAAGRKQLEQPTSLIDQYAQPNTNLASLPATLGLRGLRAGLHSLGGSDVGPRNAALGELLSRQGPQASALIDALSRSTEQRARNAAIAQPIGGMGGVFAGMLGDQAGQGRFNR